MCSTMYRLVLIASCVALALGKFDFYLNRATLTFQISLIYKIALVKNVSKVD